MQLSHPSSLAPEQQYGRFTVRRPGAKRQRCRFAPCLRWRGHHLHPRAAFRLPISRQKAQEKVQEVVRPVREMQERESARIRPPARKHAVENAFPPVSRLPSSSRCGTRSPASAAWPTVSKGRSASASRNYAVRGLAMLRALASELNKAASVPSMRSAKAEAAYLANAPDDAGVLRRRRERVHPPSPPSPKRKS